jgi:hypothetical protein
MNKHGCLKRIVTYFIKENDPHRVVVCDFDFCDVLGLSSVTLFINMLQRNCLLVKMQFS